MSGKIILDTNAVIALLSGDERVAQLAANASWVGISIICAIEFLAYPNVSEADKLLFSAFAARVEVIGLHYADEELLESITVLRSTKKIKLPDAIVAATAYTHHAALVTADKGFSGLPIELILL